MKLLLALLLALVHSTLSDEVGPEFDAFDVDAWEINYGFYPYRAFQSSDLEAPAVRRAVDTPACNDGLHTFITPRGYAVGKPGTAILDDKGDLVWGQITDGQAYDLAVQDFLGQKYISFWQGDDRVRGHGAGEYIMVRHTRLVARRDQARTLLT